MNEPSLTVFHLGCSQSERVVWLCEELALPYTLVRYERRADNRMAPPEYQALHPMGTAPVIADGSVRLGESGAIVAYLLATRGDGQLQIAPHEAGFADYLYWFHFANGTLQPIVLTVRSLERIDATGEHPVLRATQQRFERVLTHVDRRLAEAPHLAGETFTAADLMAVFSFTTMRVFKPYDLSPWPHILAWLGRIGERPAYQRAMAKADPHRAPLLQA